MHTAIVKRLAPDRFISDPDLATFQGPPDTRKPAALVGSGSDRPSQR